MLMGAFAIDRVPRLLLVRGNSLHGNQWPLSRTSTVVGRTSGDITFSDDHSLAREHVRLTFRGNDLWVEPLPTKNGVYVRVRKPERVHAGDEFMVGAQRLRLLDDAPATRTVARDGTLPMGSLLRATANLVSPIRVARIAELPTHHEVYHRAQRMLTVGRSRCDINFANDGFVSERHAQLERLVDDLSVCMLSDLQSRNGTYLRVTAPRMLGHAELILLGQQVLRVELPNPSTLSPPLL
jgi:pSer/pThr/pTyr-binding forkhead associated (FHA) protein